MARRRLCPHCIHPLARNQWHESYLALERLPELGMKAGVRCADCPACQKEPLDDQPAPGPEPA